MTGRRPATAAELAAVLLLAACGAEAPAAQPSLAGGTPPAATAATAATAPPDTGCGDPAASLRPPGATPAPGAFPAASFMRTVQARGRLVVGVPADTLLFGHRNPTTKQLEGFDVDVARHVARVMFGADDHVELRPLAPAERIPAVRDGTVDLVADMLTMTCAAWRQVDLSTAYYLSGQRVLVGRSSPAQGIQDLGGRRVCAPAGTPAYAVVARAPARPIPVGVTDAADCLALLQLGEVDGVSSDEALLLGFAAEDRSVRVVGPRLTSEPYGLGVSQAHPEFVRYLNAVLERMRADGSWSAAYDRWLATPGGPAAPPRPLYRD